MKSRLVWISASLRLNRQLTKNLTRSSLLLLSSVNLFVFRMYVCRLETIAKLLLIFKSLHLYGLKVVINLLSWKLRRSFIGNHC